MVERVAVNTLPAAAREINRMVVARGGVAFVVGGTARDILAGREPSDIDVEVFGIEVAELPLLLAAIGPTEFVGRAFPVWKVEVGGVTVDVAVPRRERQVGQGHATGFAVEADPFMFPREAAERRDFTINAIMIRAADGAVYDFFNGQADWERSILRPVGPRFAEDPLRVLRGMQFSARFQMFAATYMQAVGRRLVGEYSTISPERIWIEWEKWAASAYPDVGLYFLHQVGWMELYPALAAMEDVRHGFKNGHHGESVFSHTSLVLERLNRSGMTRAEVVVVTLAALCHDMGKAATGTVSGAFPGHEVAGVEVAKEFLASIGAPADVVEPVLTMVREHMVAVGGVLSDRAVRRLANRLGNVPVWMFARLLTADGFVVEAAGLLGSATRLSVVAGAPVPLVMGRHLVAAGMKPGPAMGEALGALFEAQLDGVFSTTEEGMAHWYSRQ